MIRLKHRLRTEFHKALATASWLDLCRQHIESRIAADGAFWSHDGRGLIASHFNEERFMGERSLCRYDFTVTVNVTRPTKDKEAIQRRYDEIERSKRPHPMRTSISRETAVLAPRKGMDRLETGLRFDAQTSSFKTCWEDVITEEVLARNAANQARLNEYAERLHSLSEDGFSNLKCPWCDGGLTVGFDSNGATFCLACAATGCDAFTLRKTEHRPPWWKDRIELVHMRS